MKKILVLFNLLFFFVISMSLTSIAQVDENIGILCVGPEFCLEPDPGDGGGPLPPTESYGNQDKPRAHWSEFTSAGVDFKSYNSWGYYKKSVDLFDSNGRKTGNIRTFYIEWKIVQGTPGVSSGEFYTKVEVTINKVVSYIKSSHTLGYDVVNQNTHLDIRNIHLSGYYNSGQLSIYTDSYGQINQELLNQEEVSFDIFSRLKLDYIGLNQPTFAQYLFTNIAPEYITPIGTLQRMYFSFSNLRDAYRGTGTDIPRDFEEVFGSSLQDQIESGHIHLRIEGDFMGLILKEKGHQAILYGFVRSINLNGTRTIHREISFDIYQYGDFEKNIDQPFSRNYQWLNHV